MYRLPSIIKCKKLKHSFFVCLFVCLLACLFACFFVSLFFFRLFVCLSVCMSVCLFFVCLFVCLLVSLFIFSFVCLFVCLFVCFCLLVCLFVFLFVVRSFFFFWRHMSLDSARAPFISHAGVTSQRSVDQWTELIWRHNWPIGMTHVSKVYKQMTSNDTLFLTHHAVQRGWFDLDRPLVLTVCTLKFFIYFRICTGICS